MNVKNYEELIVWNKAMDMVEEIYKVTDKLPAKEVYGLINQIRRAAVSVPSNIAEGNTRSTKKEYAYFLSVARGSGAELKTQILICERIEYLKREDTEKTLNMIDEIGKMLFAMINRLS